MSAVELGLGGALAGFAGVIIAPITGLNVNSISLLIVDAMAVALIASVSELWHCPAGWTWTWGSRRAR